MADSTEYTQWVEAQVYAHPDVLTTAFCDIGLGEEAGEVMEKVLLAAQLNVATSKVSGKVKRVLRGDTAMTPEQREAIGLELGDALWYLTALAKTVGFTLGEIMNMNVKKLEARRAAGTMKGTGDSR